MSFDIFVCGDNLRLFGYQRQIVDVTNSCIDICTEPIQSCCKPRQGLFFAHINIHARPPTGGENAYQILVAFTTGLEEKGLRGGRPSRQSGWQEGNFRVLAVVEAGGPSRGRGHSCPSCGRKKRVELWKEEDRGERRRTLLQLVLKLRFFPHPNLKAMRSSDPFVSYGHEPLGLIDPHWVECHVHLFWELSSRFNRHVLLYLPHIFFSNNYLP